MAESEQPKPLFRDPLAAKLVGEHGKKILATVPGHFVGAWSVVIRTVIIDDYIRQAIAAGVDTVLNLGAGLDTRPYRIDLPRSLNWIEAKIGFWITDYFSPEAIRFGEKMRAAIRSLK